MWDESIDITNVKAHRNEQDKKFVKIGHETSLNLQRTQFAVMNTTKPLFFSFPF